MKKKSGFTLAEVLITLGIIGVVAALTAPALVKNSGQAKIGPALAKFVNTFETGCEQMMTEDNESSISLSNLESLSKHIIMTPIDENSNYVFTDALGENPQTISLQAWQDKHEEGCKENAEHFLGGGACAALDSVLDNGSMIKAQLKDGSLMIISPASYNPPGEKGSYKGIIAELLYDIDGDKATNKAGKDVFGFLVDKTGTLVPIGSNALKYIANDGAYFSPFWGAIYPTNMPCDISVGDIVKNVSCTGKIADNGWKADY